MVWKNQSGKWGVWSRVYRKKAASICDKLRKLLQDVIIKTFTRLEIIVYKFTSEYEYLIYLNMEAITILKNESNNHRLMQIDLDLLSKNNELLEDVYDIIAIELRKNEETVPWEQVKQQLHDEGKL